MQQAEDMTDDSWPVGGRRLRPNPPSDSSWDGTGDVPADRESTPGESSAQEDYDWEAMLAAALGITAPAPVMYPDPIESEVAPEVEPLLPPTASHPETQPAPETNAAATFDASALMPWSGDDILPARRNGQKRRRFFGR